MNATVKGKSQLFKQNNLGELTAIFSSDGQCLIQAEDLSISGDWSSKNRNFTTQLSTASINALLKVIEKDLAVKSGLQVIFEEAEKLSFSGVERKNGTIKGSLKIKAKTLFLDYGYKKGVLSLSYDFIGARNKADEDSMLTRVEQ